MTITELNAMMDGLEKQAGTKKGSGYDSTSTSHPSASLDDNTSPAPAPGVVATEMTKDLKDQSPAERPVDATPDATPANTTKVDNPVDTPSFAIGSGPAPSSKDTKDDPGTSLPNAEAGTEKYASLSGAQLQEKFKKAADAGLAALLKSAGEPNKTTPAQTPATPAKVEPEAKTAADKPVETTPTQDATAAGYAAAENAGKVQKLAAAKALLHKTVSNTLWMAEAAANIFKEADMGLGLGAGDPAAMGAPPMDPAAAAMPPGAGGPPPGAAPMGPPPGAGGPPPGAAPGGGGDESTLDELLSAIFEAGFSPDQVQASLERVAGGAGAGAGAPPAGGPPADLGAAPPEGGGGGGESKPAKEEKSESEPAEKEAELKYVKAAVARLKSGKYSYVPVANKDPKAAARREQMKQAVRDIMSR